MFTHEQWKVQSKIVKWITVFFKILFVTATHCYIFQKKRNTVFVMKRKKRDETHMEFFKLYNSNEKQDINGI